MSEYILDLREIEKKYSGVQVLFDVNLHLKKNSVLGLVGENGAGKSTLMNILGGIVPKDSGTILLDNKEYNPTAPKDAIENGIAFIHQELNMFANMTVAENIFIDNFPRNAVKTLSYRKMRKEAAGVLDRLGEKISPNQMIGELPMGTRQMVEIGKALAKSSKIIIFDEPTTSLSNKEKEKLFSIINELKDSGVSVIYISHMLEDVFRICDDIAVLRDGKLIGQGKRDNLDRNIVVRMMVGRELSKLYPYKEKKIGSPILQVKGLCQAKTLNNITFTLHEGEIVGLFGLMGSGRSELVRAIFGIDSFDSGKVYFKNEKISRPSPEKWIQKGVALITEDRRDEGLLMSKSVKSNLVLAHLKYLKGPVNYISKKDENIKADFAIKQLQIKTYDKDSQEACMLSGGNQQKVVIGKWLLNSPEVFLMDEPTRGIDVGAKYEIYNHMNNLVTENSAILFISSEMEELMGVCDRILIMSYGKISGEIGREDFNQECLLKMAIKGEDER